MLVALHDETPIPKVIDFGVAKAVGQQLTEKTIYTGFGSLVGTPAYMAPEQATFNQLDVDTRADVCALGVLLYELLAGSPPIEAARLKKAALDEVLRLVRDEEPQRPSQRLSTSQSKASIAATRGSEPDKLSQLMRGELDWIVMKALEKDRSRRYDTATALAKDVQRYLNGDAVEACPPTLGYRLRKAYRRNRAAVLVGLAFTACLVLVTVALTYGLTEAAKKAQLTELLDRADHARMEAEEARESLALSHYSRTIGLSYREFLLGHQNRSQELLEKCFERFRGWEWHYLAEQIHPELLCLTHQLSVHAAAFNPDGTQVVTASSDGHIRIWDGIRGQMIRRIESPEPMTLTVVFSPDGKRLITSHDMSARVWSVADGKELLKLEHPDKVFAAAINHDGTRIATSCQDRRIRVWDATTGQELLSVDRYRRSGGRIQFSPSGQRHVFENGADPLAVIDANTGADVKILWPPSEFARSPNFSPDGTQIAFAKEGTVNGYEINSNRLNQTVWLNDSTGNIYDLVWTHRGDQIITVDDKNTIGLWDVKRREQLARFRGHVGRVNSVALSHDGNLLVTTSSDGTARIWSMKQLPRKHILRPRTGIHSLALSPDGSKALIGGKGEVQMWDLNAGKQLWVQKCGSNWIETVSFSHDGRRVVSAGEDRKIVMWDAREGMKICESVIDAELMKFVLFHPNANLILTNGPQGTIQLLSADTLQPIRSIVHPAGPVWSVTFSSDGRWFVTSAGGDGALRIWDATTWNLTRVILTGGSKLNSLCLSGDSSRLAGRVRGGEVLIFDVPTGQQIRSIPCPWNEGESLALSPDGTRVAVSGDNDELHIWEVDSGFESLQLVVQDLVIHLNTEPSKVYPIAFTPDGKPLVSAAYDQSIRIWDSSSRNSLEKTVSDFKK